MLCCQLGHKAPIPIDVKLYITIILVIVIIISSILCIPPLPSGLTNNNYISKQRQYSSFISSRELSHKQPPHIIFILGDDIGWSDVSWHGGDILTPRMEVGLF